ncbi:MAG: hypothetical protein HGGPFJEG_00686 [Ignavibacteria bacterium]|nr:hypothetical protein [Ignavibacteria bacterium]
MKKLIYHIIILSLLSACAVNSSEAFMFWNKACGFNGSTSSYIATPSSASLNITGSFTIEAWLHPFNSTSPLFQIISEKRAGTLSNGYTLYLNNGRVAIRTNNSTRLIGQTVLPNYTWTHVAGTYNSQNNLFSIYINGILDTSVVINAAAPVANSDSLRIGKGNINSPFAGYIDEFRIWRGQQNSSEISKYMRTSLGASSGIYDSLILSFTFQNKNFSASAFSLSDWSGNSNNGLDNGITETDLSNRPSVTIDPNECVELDGINDILYGSDNAFISPISAVTLEAWIFPRDVSGARMIIQKGTIGTGINYALGVNAGMLFAIINNTSIMLSNAPIDIYKWTHVAFSYSGSSGQYVFYKNGRKTLQSILSLGMIDNGTENLFIGGNTTVSITFNGFIDEIRISNYVKSQAMINSFLYRSIDQSNEPNSGMNNVVYNLDGYSYDNADSGPILMFMDAASFSHPSTVNNQPVSPLNRQDGLNYQNGFSLKSADARIPSTGISGIISDSIEICFDTLISEMNVFLALNHTNEEELSVSITGPQGQTVTLFANHALAGNSDNLITIFDDNSDTSLNSSARLVSFSPSIKPKNPLNSVFAGKRTAGKWKLTINDNTGPGIGRLYAWGVQFNNVAMRTSGLCLRVFMEGFYRPEDSCVVDTIKVHLNESEAPYLEVGVKGETPDNNYIGHYSYPDAVFGTSYYLEVDHRNSINIWSANPIEFDLLSGSFVYDFTVSADSAYGSNQVEVDDAPLRFAMFGGDVNKDGSVDASDLSEIDNDASEFEAGYVVTDLTGDDLVDASDYAIADNNSSAFVTVISP